MAEAAEGSGLQRLCPEAPSLQQALLHSAQLLTAWMLNRVLSLIACSTSSSTCPI